MGGDVVAVGAVVGRGRREEIGDDGFLVVEFPEAAGDDGLTERFLRPRSVSAGSLRVSRRGHTLERAQYEYNCRSRILLSVITLPRFVVTRSSRVGIDPPSPPIAFDFWVARRAKGRNFGGTSEIGERFPLVKVES